MDMLRFDEIVMDKASKYDVVTLSKRVDLCSLTKDFKKHVEV